MADFSAWAAYKPITVQDAYVDGNLTDFPLCVDITAESEIGGRCRADGHDLRFTLSDGSTELKYEREQFSVSGGVATGHLSVKTPSIAASGGASIRCYYGKADASDGEDAANASDANFIGIWRMSDAGPTVVDSKGNNNGSGVNTPTFGAMGKIADAISFAKATSEYINFGSGINMAGWTGLTVSAWVKYDSSGSDEHTIFSNWKAAPNDKAAVLFRLNPSDDSIEAYVVEEQNSQKGGSFADLTVSADSWHHVVMTWDTTNGLKAYCDGVASGTSYASSAALDASASLTSEAARSPHIGDDYLNGTLDDLRVSNVARSLDWSKFEYRNAHEADNELTWGAEVAVEHPKTIKIGPSLSHATLYEVSP